MRRPKEEQYRSFGRQIALAKKWDLPLIVHSRDATAESTEVLARYAPLKGIMHCFSDGSAAARKYLDMGFHLSFAGNVTYRTATLLQESAAYVRAHRLLLETDAPFLAPVPMRGKKNRPDYVSHTYRFVAELRKENISDLAGHRRRYNSTAGVAARRKGCAVFIMNSNTYPRDFWSSEAASRASPAIKASRYSTVNIVARRRTPIPTPTTPGQHRHGDNPRFLETT